MAQTLYVVVYSSALSAPSGAQITAGTDINDSAAVYSSNKTVSSSGSESFIATGLTPSTGYKASFVWYDGSNYSNVVTTNEFTTTVAAVTGSLSVQESIVDVLVSVGLTLITGSISVQEESSVDSTSISGTVLIQGSISTTESFTDTVNISGIVISSGSLNATDSYTDTAVFSGSIASQLSIGTLSVTETYVDTPNISGITLISGTLNITESPVDSSDISGTVLISGTINTTEDGFDTAVFTSAVLTLTPSDISAIAEAVYNKFISEGVVVLLEAVYKAHMHKRTREGSTGVITIYEDDNTTPYKQFDSNSDVSVITPK